MDQALDRSSHRRRLILTAASLAALAALPGCIGPTRGRAVPCEVQDQAVIPGLTPAVRTWGAAVNPQFEQELFDSARRERECLGLRPDAERLPRADFLALSGGGADGAFGAGLLCGWTVAGDRPEFKVVTGISTGALIAPFAYLGPEYDGILREVYTQTSTRDLLVHRPLLEAITSDAFCDNRPMWKYVAKYVDQPMVDRIAAEYRKGRLLIIGTTNIDARRAVLWNVGAIAASGNPCALELVRKIMIASASIPAAFPPVMVDVEVDGQPYQEMHVDGGAMTQVFLYPPSVRLGEAARAAGFTRERRAFIIRNSRLDPDWAETQRRTLPIAARAISSLIQTQGIGDLYRTYLNTQRDGVEYNLAFIPPTFKEQPKEEFDREYMNKLFDVGYELARQGYPWQDTPPGFDGVISVQHRCHPHTEEAT